MVRSHLLVILMAHNNKQKVMDMYKHARHPFHPSLPAVVNWIMDGRMVCRGHLTTVQMTDDEVIKRQYQIILMIAADTNMVERSR